VTRIAAALERADDDLARPSGGAAPDGRPRRRRLAIGDPQAPAERFFEILDGKGLLGDDGRLAPEVALASMGDHFDWGAPNERGRAARDGERILAWLAAHPADQVTLIAGNHDLARVGELARFDDASFAEAQAHADLAYRDGVTDGERERALLERWPDVPTAECLARDFSTFRASQRARVAGLLAERRLVLGHAAADDLLLVHAGVTDEDLAAVDLPPSQRGDARAIAGALAAELGRALAAWDGRSPLAVGALHRPGTAHAGEARGMLLHRPSDPDRDEAASFARPARRYDPRRLPRRLTQAVGHIRDNKCRKLLARWCKGDAAGDGPLRHLATDGIGVAYAAGPPAGASPGEARMVFLDGGMRFCEPARYQLFDLDRRAPI
jgi:hypothetical protein